MEEDAMEHNWNISSSEELHGLFGWEEYLVLSMVLLVSLLIGVYFAWRGQRSTSEFLMASREMTLFPTCMSLSCSFISAITILGTPAEMYTFGTQYWMIGVSYPFVLAATAHIYLPVFYELKLTSIHEYLERRFHLCVRIFASLCFIMLTCLYLAIVVYAPSLALSQVTGMQVDVSIAVTFVVCVFYTAIGGLKAVIWTNVFQAFCMLTSCLVVVIVGESAVGGSERVFRANYETERIELFNLDPSILVRHTFWSQVVGGYFTWMTIYAINQTMIQRYLAVPSIKTAKMAIWLSGLAITVILSIVAYAGLIIYARYENCDPVRSGLVSTKDQLLPLFVMDLMGQIPGFPGFFVAGVFSGALSTVSGGLNSLAAVTLEDFIRVFHKTPVSDVSATRLSKCLAAAYGVFSYLLVFMVQDIPGLVQAWLGIFGILGGPVLGLFSLGLFLPFANTIGAMVGGLTSIFFMLWISIGGNLSRLSGQLVYETKVVSIEGCPAVWNITEPEAKYLESLEWWHHLPVYEISYMWYSAVGTLLVLVVGSMVSLLTGPATDTDPALLGAAVERLMCCWPRAVRRWVRQKEHWVASRKEEMVHLRQDGEKA